MKSGALRRRFAATVLLPLVFLGLPNWGLADSSQLIRSSTGSGQLYEKLIVSSDDAFFVRELGPSAKRELTPAFSIYYRLKTSTPDNAQEGYYRFGGPDGKAIGWIKKEFVTSWNTRFCLEPIRPLPDRHFTVFADAEGNRPVLKHTRVPDGTKRFAMIRSVPATDAADPLHEVVVFTGLTGESGGTRQQELMSLYNLELEVVFLIASTASMEHLIEVAREISERTSRALASMADLKEHVHFGLVEYRDAPPHGDFAVRIRCSLSEGYAKFQHELAALDFSSKGDDDWPDDVVAGLSVAVHDVGWRPNSSKHIILLGDCPAKDGYDPVLEKEQQSSMGKSLADVLSDARPRGGSDAQRAVKSHNFHALCNNHQREVDRFIDAVLTDSTAAQKASFREVVEEPEIVKLANTDPEQLAVGLVETGLPAEAAVEFVKLVRVNDSRKKWQARAESQFQKISSNQGELEGYYMTLNTYKSPSDKDRAVQGLTEALNRAYQALAAAREGQDPDRSAALSSGGSISQAIYQIVGTKADASRFEGRSVSTGYARTRDESGRLVAHQRVMVFREELMRLYSALDSLYTTFKNRSDRADRQNVSDILEDLKRAIASQATGQQLDEKTDLQTVIAFDFPMKTPALEISAQQIAVMTTPAFNNWLESLATARDRAKSLVLGGKTDWTKLANELDQEFSFLLLSELP